MNSLAFEAEIVEQQAPGARLDEPRAETPDDRAARWSRGIRDGDRAALASFYEAWFDRALGVARAFTGRDEAFCLDVVQDAMVRVVRSITPVGTNARLEAWLLRVIRSTCVDRIRREARRAARERASILARPDSEAALEARVELAGLARRLRGLDPDDLELVTASAGVGPSLAQIARLRGVSQDAVTSRARRVMVRLRGVIEEPREGAR